MAKHDDLYKAKDSLEKNLREVNKFLAADKVAKNRESSRVYAREQKRRNAYADRLEGKQ